MSRAIVARVLNERAALGLTLLALVVLSWAYLAFMAADMAAEGGVSLGHCAAMPGMTSSSAAYVFWLFVMWAAMGVAMMLPTALPLVSLFARFQRQRHPESALLAPALGLVLGYLLAWFAFGAAAALAQWGLEQLGTLTPVVAQMRTPLAGGLVLAGAGIFQLSPLKTACLMKCRTPLAFLMTRWREGTRGAIGMGLEHGAFCLGCCWALMLVMFVVGVMNLLWMALLGVLMLLEKVAPRGDLLARLSGVALVLLGMARILAD